MIEVLVLTDEQLLAKVEIKNIHVREDGSADYTVRFAVERGSAVGLHRRHIFYFPRKQLNVLALVKLALESLNEKELELERDFDPDAPEASVPSDLARRLRETMREIQARVSRLHSN